VSTFTLRITIKQDPTTATLKLEGRLAGPWIAECVQAWQTLAPSLGPKTLHVDLCGLTFVDRGGADLLAEIYSKHRAQFLTNTPLTKYFAEQAIRTWADRGAESARD
jgi:ABC-type transporter Mla MlaB component